ncbi:hypothetical protein [Planococcus lenghuensis]|uniref:Uncharacterized protein n=1 Tax=Planococcus lenghuensis TaxID=2213202 RepID=A0A1Q2KYG1_9BACL|nr:hypothetical protein [Planococcus lenghuensis]AQQ53144.1 hypothetical protein B0X71_08600 [Planococcus lenghuensis]
MKFANRRMSMVLLSLILISVLIVVNEWLYNGVMQVLVPITIIVSCTVILWNAKSLSVLRAVIVTGLVVLSIYMVLPEYTAKQAAAKIRTEFEGVGRVSFSVNTPVISDSFSPFQSDWYYTFEVIEREGTGYYLMMDPHSDDFMVKQNE